MTKTPKKKASLKKIDEASFEEEVTYIDEKDVEIVFENEEKIHDKFRRNGPIKKYLNIVSNLFSMLKDYKNGKYREMPWHTIASVIVVLLYVLNPLDIIPDFLPGFGFIDDASVFALAYKFIKTDYENYMTWKNNESNPKLKDQG